MTTKQEIKVYDFSDTSSLINMAETVKNHIVSQKLYTSIQGKNYVSVEGWQFAGGLIGVFPKVVEVKKVPSDVAGEHKYEATVDLVHAKSGATVGSGWAMCSSKEKGKGAFQEYAVASMAQTRATGKAFRLMIGWVMKTAGYEATPVEEMEGVSTVHTSSTDYETIETMAKNFVSSPKEVKDKFLDTYKNDLSEEETEKIKQVMCYETA